MVDVAIHAILPNIYISSPSALVRGSLRDATRGRDVATGNRIAKSLSIVFCHWNVAWRLQSGDRIWSFSIL